ncbi:MAG: hypothetical protein ACREN8_03325 [Candidatus Dormibacteraceae bacterium]
MAPPGGKLPGKGVIIKIPEKEQLSEWILGLNLGDQGQVAPKLAKWLTEPPSSIAGKQLSPWDVFMSITSGLWDAFKEWRLVVKLAIKPNEERWFEVIRRPNSYLKTWSRRGESNPGPAAYEANVLILTLGIYELELSYSGVY